jgi:O-antigen/teichoic acid export membrane protein
VLAGLVVMVVTRSVVACIVTTNLVIVAFAVYGWRRLRIGLFAKGFSPGRWPRLAGGGIPFAAAALTVGLYGGIDNVLLGFFARAEVAGWYAAAYRIISVPVFIPTLLITPLFPALSRQATDRDGFRQTVQRCLTAMLYTSLPICAVLIALAPSVPSTLRWAPSFANSIPLIQILALHQPLVATDMVLVTALAALGRERRWLWVTAFLAIANPASNLVLIPLFETHAQNGAIGAAIATVATEAMAFVGALLLLPRMTVHAHTFGIGLRAGMAALGAGLVAAELRQISLPLAVVASAAVYGGLGAALRLWTRRDLRQGYGAARRSLRRRLPTSLVGSQGPASIEAATSETT